MDSNSKKLVTIYVQLLEEATFTARPTEAVPLENGLYKLLPTPDYDPEDEKWEFPPGTIVRTVKRKSSSGDEYPLAVKV